MSTRYTRLFFTLALTGVAGCTAGTEPPVERASVAAVVRDDGADACLELPEARVCYRADGTARVLEKSLPQGVAPPSGWRCGGRGNARRCEARRAHSGPFRCDGARCVQQRPRTPDAAEWECVELAGVVYCRSAVDAAGIAPGERDPAFQCGQRLGTDESICVDFAPDPPPERGWTCGTRYESGAAARLCSAAHEPHVGDACSAPADCPRDARCLSARCVPPKPAPACWFDTDCGEQGRCRWGSCIGGT